MFSLPLRGPHCPPWTKKVFSPTPRGPSRTKKSCSPRPSAALRVLRGQKKGVLRAPPRPSVSSADKKGVLPDPSWPFADKKKLFSAPLRGPPCPPRTKKVFSPTPRGPSRTKKSCSPRPSAALRVLRGQKRCSPRPLRGQKRCSPRPYPPSRTKHTLPLQSQFTQTPTTPNLYPARKVRPPSDP